MYNKILIANRGEIALRIIRACKELGIKTVTVHSTADADSLHVKMADESMCIGGPRSMDSYLKIPAIVSVAEITGADAIHPGYGFLAEDDAFVEKCIASKIDFIGPSAQSINLMGNKIRAREIVDKAGVPTTPGTKDAVTSDREMLEVADQIGFPLIIKAAAGGGGKGMRIVHSPGGLLNAYEMAKSEALNCFNNGDVFVERYIENPRHIEIQVLADKYGNTIHLGERDCSIQRRNQKIIEEAPGFGISKELREKMGDTAVKAAKAAGYFSAGTIEFLFDQKTSDFYFMEMNTRVQVEHPISEMISGVDIVKEQILIAAGEKLSLTQKDVELRGHAIECRINAEDPDKFTPSPGKITAYHPPGGFGVRVESAAYQGYMIPPYYDSMIAKLIVHGKNRNEAIRKMIVALDEFVIEGVKTTIPLHRRIFASLRYQEGKMGTDFLKNFVKM